MANGTKNGTAKEATPAPAKRQPADVKRLWTVADVAARLVLNPNTVYKMARRGDLPCIKINARNLRFDPEEIAAHLAKRGASIPTVEPEE